MKKILQWLSTKRLLFVGITLIFMVGLVIFRGTQQTPDKRLFEAVRLQEYEEVKADLEAGANPNLIVQPELHTPPAPILTYAMMWSGPIPATLVEKGADANAIGADNAPILIRAIEKQDVGLVASLLNKGADPNCNYRINPRGYTVSGGKNALITALELGKLDIVKLLLQKGANPNYKLRDDANEYAIASPVLIWAVRVNPSAVRLLLQAGADPMVKDKHGHSALDKARLLKRTEAVAQLTQWQKVERRPERK